MDGTLTDTVPLVVRGLNAALGPVWGGPRTVEQMLHLFGPSEERLIRQEAGEGSEEAIERFYRCYRAEHDRHAHVFPEVEAMLSALRARGVALGIVTNKGRSSTQITLEAFGLAHHFSAIRSGDDVARPKPDPTGIVEVMRELGADRRRSVYVGDSPSDMLAARAAGVRALGAGWSGGAPRLAGPADEILDSPMDVVRLVQELAG